MQHLSLSCRMSGLKQFRPLEHLVQDAVAIRQTKMSRRTGPVFSTSLVLALFLMLLLPLHAGAGHGLGGTTADAAAPFSLNSVSATAPSADDFLQFTAGGHVLGFASDAAWLATGSHALRVGFDGANAVTPQSETPLAAPGQTAALERVTYANLWDGITLTYDAAKGTIAKSTYHLAPGANPAQIRLHYNAPVELQTDGSLRLRFQHGWMTESAPSAWQEVNGRRAPVDVAFRVDGQMVAFSLGDYDPARPLTIDPAYVWHAFYGSSSADSGFAIARDGSGNLYVAGSSNGTWNGPNETPPLQVYKGGYDMTVLSLTSAGAYRWHTFYGSAIDDQGQAIALDGSGNLYVAGSSSETWGSPINPYTGSKDITVLSLTSAGVYRWHTFYGGIYDDEGRAIAVDGNGSLYVAGYSKSAWGSSLNSYTGGERHDRTQPDQRRGLSLAHILRRQQR